MRTFVVLLFSVMLIVGSAGQLFAATGYMPDQTSVAYGYVHGGYVGKAIVNVQADGALNVKINEAFLPHTLASVDLDSAEWSDANTAYYVLRGRKISVAKHVEYDGVVYVGTTVGTSLTYVKAGDNGEAVGGKDLELLILKNQATMANYFDKVTSGGFKIIAKFNGMAKPVTTTASGAVTKAESPNYWAKGQTWKGNIAAVEKFIEENGSAYSVAEMKRTANADGLKLWSVADAVTGATMIDFKDYFNMAQLAIAQLKMK